ncbi:hypothetical protein UPYG_G00055980 [Umbra pygmaea]|uniref:BRCA1-associated ATM activator 1 n=1 Tax=Umbra pygmaea TaxID=75934 RepID=A0ABD0X883_UMBPY
MCDFEEMDDFLKAKKRRGWPLVSPGGNTTHTVSGQDAVNQTRWFILPIRLREIAGNAQLQESFNTSYTQGLRNIARVTDSVMDSECVMLLPRVCAVLADPRHSLPDDTSLEKLLDWFTVLTKEDNGLALLESCPCLVDYISTVCQDKTTDPSLLSFSLKLSGLLAASQHGFNLLQDRSILGVAYDIERWKGTGLWEDPSVRIGWLHGLSNMMQNPQALQFLEQGGLTKPILQLQTDASLFVASAANHLLARLLTSHQTTAANEEKELSITAGKGSITMEILKHLESSLVSDSHTQVLQGLRLLSIALPQAEAALWGLVMSQVLRPLEGLVRAGRRDVTQPLVDVLLSAYKSGPCDSRLISLIMDMLNSQNPSDASLCAASVLHLETCPPALRERTVSVLLQPLQAITGVTLLERRPQTSHRQTDPQTDHRQTDTEQDRQWDDSSSLLVDHLNQKPSCISLICLCVSSTPSISHRESSSSVIHAVTSLLRLCNGHSLFAEGAAPNGCSKARTNLIGCSKVQRCGLDALASLSTCPGAVALVKDVFNLLLQYLQNTESDPTVLQKSYQAMLSWLRVSTEALNLTQELLPVLNKRVCDVRWEVRDSTVEFLGHLCVCGLVSACTATPVLLAALCDQQSYVRASAISGLAKCLPLALPFMGQQGAQQALTEEETVRQLLDILSHDSEGFARRAVVQFFVTWQKTHPSSSSTTLCTVLSLGSADLDWEVKCHTLELADLLLQEILPGQQGSESGSAPPTLGLSYGVSAGTTLTTQGNHTPPYAVTSSLASPLLPPTPADRTTIPSLHPAASGLSRLVDLGVVTALLNSLFDCDRPVALKACKLLLRLRHAVCPKPPGDAATAAENPTLSVDAVMFDLRGHVWGLEVVRKLDERKGWEAVCPRPCEGSVSVCEVLWTLDLSERLSILSRSSDHVQNSPLSLLQDILTSTHLNDTEEVIVDCY